MCADYKSFLATQTNALPGNTLTSQSLLMKVTKIVNSCKANLSHHQNPQRMVIQAIQVPIDSVFAMFFRHHLDDQFFGNPPAPRLFILREPQASKLRKDMGEALLSVLRHQPNAPWENPHLNIMYR